MDKNEILEKARKENKGDDEMIKRIKEKAMATAFGVGFIISSILYALDSLIFDTGLIGSTAMIIYMSMLFTETLMLGVLGKKKRSVILGSIGIGITAVLFVAFILARFS